MNRYLLYIFLGFLTPCFFWLAAFYFQLGAPMESSRWINDLLTIKRDIVLSKDGRRLLVVSGSNGHFGIRTKDIEKSLSIPTVNFSSHAGLSLGYILYHARTIAKSGDIILLPIEYEFYMRDGDLHNVYVDYVTSWDAHYFREMSLLNKAKFISSIGVERLQAGLKSIFYLSDKKSFDISEKLNENGDEIFNKASGQTEEEREKIARLKPLKLLFNRNAKSLQRLKKFALWAGDHNVKLIATYPNTVYFPNYQHGQYKTYFLHIKEFWNGLGVQVLGNPYDFMHEKKYFLNSGYHLNDVGMSLSTKRLIELLNPIILEIRSIS